MSRLVNFFKTRASRVKKWTVAKSKPIYYDYKFAAEDCAKEAVSRPFNTLFWTGASISAVYMYYTVPTELSFQGTLNEASNDLLLLGDGGYDQEADDHVMALYDMQAKEQLRYKWLGLFSVMYRSEHGREVRNFHSQCKYANPRWHELPGTVVDVGACGRWWVIGWRMVDFDVDFKLEFESQIERLRYQLKRVFGRGYFDDLVAQPVKHSYYIDCEAIAAQLSDEEYEPEPPPLRLLA